MLPLLGDHGTILISRIIILDIIVLVPDPVIPICNERSISTEQILLLADLLRAVIGKCSVCLDIVPCLVCINITIVCI